MATTTTLIQVITVVRWLIPFFLFSGLIKWSLFKCMVDDSKVKNFIKQKLLLRLLQLCVALCAMPVPAHDLIEAGSNAKWEPKRISYMPVDHTPRSRPGILLPEYVIKLPNRWAVGQDIHLCFVGGSDQRRAQIIAVMQGWFQHVNLKLVTGGLNGKTCVPNDRSEIRLGFSEPGYWSYVGSDSLSDSLVSNNLTSMNLQGFDTEPPVEPRFSGIILHETGHALGFEHEHQSPAGGCDKEYDWPKLYAYYQRVYGWNQSMVDQNVKQLVADRSAYAWSQFDPQSIMIYGSDPQFLFKGVKSACYLHDNNTLSGLDIKGAESIYPSGDVTEMLQARVSALTQSAAKLKSGPLQRLLLNQAVIHQTQIHKIKTDK